MCADDVREDTEAGRLQSWYLSSQQNRVLEGGQSEAGRDGSCVVLPLRCDHHLCL